MLVKILTIILISIAVLGWLFLKRDPERYIHEQKSPMNFFFRWGRLYHHFFKVGIITLFMVSIFSLYKFLNASNNFATMAALISGIVLSGGKELLDKKITPDDILTSILGITFGFFIIFIIVLVF